MHSQAIEDYLRAIYELQCAEGQVGTTLLAERLGLNFQRLPVSLVREYDSTLSLRRHTLSMLCDIARLWWRDRRKGLPGPQSVPPDGTVITARAA